MKPHEIALSNYGLKELPGEEHNPKILNFFAEIGHEWVQTDEMAWCAAFVNYCCKMSGYEMSGKLNARSFLEVGEGVTIPQQGDIVVLWRESKKSWKGHVGFFVREDENFIWVLGGNQSNSVCIKPYPKKQLLEYRRVIISQL